MYNLESKISCSPTKLCNSEDHEPIPKDFYDARVKLLRLDEMKTELDIDLRRPKMELDADKTISNKNKEEEIPDMLEINVESIDCVPDDDDYIPQVKKKRKTAPNPKKRKTKKTKIKKECKNSKRLVKKSMTIKRQEYSLNKETSKKEVSGPIQQRGPRLNASNFKDYATIVLLTPEDAKKELLLRKECSTYKISNYKCEYCYRGYELKPAFDNHMKKHDKVRIENDTS